MDQLRAKIVNLVPKRIKNLLILVRFYLVLFWIKLFTAFARRICSKIILTCDNEFKKDGTGAQLQRQFATHVVSTAINSSYIYSPITDVAVHPLDPFQTQEEYNAFLHKLNQTFCLVSATSDKQVIDKVISIATPSIVDLVRTAIVARIKNEFTVVKIGEPYKISEYFQDFYDRVSLQSSNFALTANDRETREKQIIAVHFRQGVGGKVVYPGQKISRELDLGYFFKTIKTIISDQNPQNFKIIVLTDAPNTRTKFEPPISQVSLWNGTPGFKDGALHIMPFQFDALGALGAEFEIISGGDPLDAIVVMASSDYLIMGRSSLSFVAGVLNRSGEVFSAPDFWHRPLTRWRKPLF